MTRNWIALSFGALLLGLTPVAAAAQSATQSLAALGRAEEAKRKEHPKPTKVYTNQDLRRDPTAPSAGAAPPAAAPASTPSYHGAGADSAASAAASTAPAAGTAAGASADAGAAAATPAKDQKYWQERIGAARADLERSRTFADALQSRVSALTTDFVNRDDPAQRAVIEQNRLKAVAELERVQREIAAHTKTIAGIEDEARKAGVPAGWLR